MILHRIFSLFFINFFIFQVYASNTEELYPKYKTNFEKCSYKSSFVPEEQRTLLTYEQYKQVHDQLIDLEGSWKPKFRFGSLPSKQKHEIRISNYNVEWAGFDSIVKRFDGQGRPDYLMWQKRFPAIKALINFTDPDILFLQELNPIQIKDFQTHFSNYSVTAVSATKGLVIGENKTKTAESLQSFHNQNYLGIMSGMAIKNTFSVEENGFFYLNSNPNFYPNRIHPEIAYPDEKFGSIRAERVVTWAKVKHLETNNIVFIATSHFPLDQGKYRHECAALCVQQLKELSKGQPIIFGGDLNLFKDTDGIPAYKYLVSELKDWRSKENHFGHTGTFAGFSSDNFKTPIDDQGDFKGILGKGAVLDFIGYQGFDVKNSFALMSEFNPETQEIYPFDAPIYDTIKRAFGSDHALIGNTVTFVKK